MPARTKGAYFFISLNGAAAIGSSWKEIYFLTDISDSRQFCDVAREASGRAELAGTAAPFCKIASDSERFCRTLGISEIFLKRSVRKIWERKFYFP